MPDQTSPFDLLALRGKHVLVTGAAGGIGRALAATFQAAGAFVTGADRRADALAEVDLDRRMVLDIADRAAVAASLAELQKEAGTPDILVNNAGFTRGETLDQVDDAVWDNELAINLTGAYAVTTPLLEGMRQRGSGSIVFIASVNGLAHFGNPAYSAAKAGLIAYARGIAVERGRDGIRSNVVCPGSVRTPAWDHRFERTPDLLEKVLPHYPLGRMVTPADVAQTVLFLASPLASGITGAIIPVDAGLTAGNSIFVNTVIGAP